MKEHTIGQVVARQIFDSRGNPTIEAEVVLQDGTTGAAAVPSGASTGSREAVEMRDGGDHYLGRGVTKAVAVVNDTINYALTGVDAEKYREVDRIMLEMDGTPNKAKLGANAMLAVSLACTRAVATSNGLALYMQIAAMLGQPAKHLPVPMMNVINGGAHADNSIDFQEFMIQPVGLSGFTDALRAGVEIFHQLKAILKKRGLATSVGDEGGFAPDLPTSAAVLDTLSEAVTKAGYTLGKDITLALDCAASEMYQDGTYTVEGRQLDSGAMVEHLADLCKAYPIASIEDGLDENDWNGWRQLTDAIGNTVQLVGDDLFVTNSEILQQGIARKVANAILIKPNQIGTLSETLDCISTAHHNGYHTVISHRSGETEDSFIADLAVGSGSRQIKTGSLSRSDRMAKYNQLLRICYNQPSIPYAGKSIRKRP